MASEHQNRRRPRQEVSGSWRPSWIWNLPSDSPPRKRPTNLHQCFLMTNSPMIPRKYPQSTLNGNNSLPPSQMYTKASRGILKNPTERLHPVATEPRRRFSISPKWKSISFDERDLVYPATPMKQYDMIKQTTRSSKKSIGSSNSDFSSEYPKKTKSLDCKSQSSSQEITKQHTRKTQKIIEELISAKGHDGRIAVFSVAFKTFDHDDELLHNVELDEGVANAFAKQLVMTSNDEEVRMICSVLEMVFRGSPKSILASYEKIGHTFPSILLRILNRCEAGNVKNADMTVLNIWHILSYLSRCRQLRSSLCRLKGVFSAFTRVSKRALQLDCRVARMRFIATIANCDDNKELIFESSGVFESLLRAAHFDFSDQVRNYAAITLAELASSIMNQTRMAENEILLGTMVKMILLEKNDSTREAVITAIQNLSFAKINRVQMVSYKNGIVLEALKKAIVPDDKDPKARRRAAGALTNLASEETAEIMGNHKGLLEALAIAATKDTNIDVQSRAALALTKISSGITVHMDCHEALLDALVVTSLSKASNNVTAVLRVKARDPQNRETLARHPGIVDTLCDICTSHNSTTNDRDNAARAIMNLVNDDNNHSLMCTKSVLDALTACAGFNDPDLLNARDSSIRALERLATHTSNRSIMARHPGLLTAIAMAVEREAEWEDDPDLSESGGLAKPLLMSLLIAL